ncbi:MAG: nuclear transport factor 2 family protein, partial [Terriglobales bacterium]
MTKSATAHDEAQIRQLIADETGAICGKNVDGIMAHYADDVVVFNVKPPLQIRGASAFRRIWVASLAHFPAAFWIETRDVRVMVGSDLAVAHWFLRFTGMG